MPSSLCCQSVSSTVRFRSVGNGESGENGETNGGTKQRSNAPDDWLDEQLRRRNALPSRRTTTPQQPMSTDGRRTSQTACQEHGSLTYREQVITFFSPERLKYCKSYGSLWRTCDDSRESITNHGESVSPLLIGSIRASAICCRHTLDAGLIRRFTPSISRRDIEIDQQSGRIPCQTQMSFQTRRPQPLTKLSLVDLRFFVSPLSIRFLRDLRSLFTGNGESKEMCRSPHTRVYKWAQSGTAEWKSGSQAGQRTCMHALPRLLTVAAGIILCAGTTLPAQWRVQTKGVPMTPAGAPNLRGARPEAGGPEHARLLGNLGRGERAMRRGQSPLGVHRRPARHPTGICQHRYRRARAGSQRPHTLPAVGAGPGQATHG